MPSIDINLVERFTGQRRVISVDAALLELNPATAAYDRARSNFHRLGKRLMWAKVKQRWAIIRAWVAMLPVRHSVAGWAMLLSCCALISVGGSLAAILVAHVSLSIVTTCILTPFLGFGLLPLMFPNDPSALSRAAAAASEQLNLLRRDRLASRAMLDDCFRRYSGSKRIYEGILRARDYPVNRLLNADFRAMSGPDFECFLAEIFALLGYAVRSTGRSGDQGVDLVVSRNGTSAAVQAKCYRHPVGNAAVQQAYTGMRIYGCHRCVVITASSFTHGAREAAIAVGCTLIEGGEIHSLIRGRIVL